MNSKNSIKVNIEGPKSCNCRPRNENPSKWRNYACGCHILSLTIGKYHFIDNQFDNRQQMIERRQELINDYGFEMGKDYGGK